MVRDPHSVQAWLRRPPALGTHCRLGGIRPRRGRQGRLPRGGPGRGHGVAVSSGRLVAAGSPAALGSCGWQKGEG